MLCELTWPQCNVSCDSYSYLLDCNLISVLVVITHINDYTLLGHASFTAPSHFVWYVYIMFFEICGMKQKDHVISHSNSNLCEFTKPLSFVGDIILIFYPNAWADQRTR